MRVALVQLDSGASRPANLRAIAGYIQAAAAGGAELVLLPEAGTYRGPLRADTVEDTDGPSLTALAELAARHGVAVLLGGIWLRSGDPGRPYNASVLLSEHGELLARYDKVHLFKVSDPEVTEDESAATTPGERLAMVSWRGWNLGLSVCYDLRFPELYRKLAAADADVLCVPANFSAYTGRAHWEPLLRARAIENLCYVLAPAECGTAPDGFASHGNTMVIDPWGAIAAAFDAPASSPGVLIADLSREELKRRRAALASPAEARPDVYARDVVRTPARVR